LPAGERNRHAPVEVAGNRSRFQVAHYPERVFADVRPPAVVLLDPPLQLLAERRQVEEKVLRLPKLHRRVASALVRIDQVDRVQLVAAVVALVAARVGETTDRTLA